MHKIVAGAYWGDEGKGKIVDILAEDADVVVRYNGGDNAGHTIVIGGKKVVLHILPTGALQGKDAAIGADVFFNPVSFLKDLQEITEKGFRAGKIIIDPRAHLIMPYHIALDKAQEDRGAGVGSTRRGIGPVAEDKANRKRDLKVADLYEEGFAEKVRQIVEERAEELVRKGIITTAAAAASYAEKIATEYRSYGEKLKRYVGDVVYALQHRRSILMEGAQGTLLDVVHGTRPYVTSSNTVAGAALANLGMLRNVEVYGILKAYPTRVGDGPFPTQLGEAEEGEKELSAAEKEKANSGNEQLLGRWIRVKGKEYGATTGRPRRVGMPDFVALKYSALLNGFDCWMLTKADVLAGIKIRGCTAYEKDGSRTERFPANLGGWKAVYTKEYFWPEDTDWKQVREKKQLPAGLQRYVDDIALFTGVKVRLVSFSPERSDVLWL